MNLPRPSIDTGMGLERIAAVMQGVHDNYDTDTFKALIEASQSLTSNAAAEMTASHRIIADHLRTSGFLVADGVVALFEQRRDDLAQPGFVRADGHMIGFFYCALLPVVAFPVLFDEPAPRQVHCRQLVGREIHRRPRARVALPPGAWKSFRYHHTPPR